MGNVMAFALRGLMIIGMDHATVEVNGMAYYRIMKPRRVDLVQQGKSLNMVFSPVSPLIDQDYIDRDGLLVLVSEVVFAPSPPKEETKTNYLAAVTGIDLSQVNNQGSIIKPR